MPAEPPASEPKNGPNIPLGFMFAGSEMASFTILGLILDYVFSTMPGFTIGFTLLGLVAAFVHLKTLAKAISKPKPPQSGTGTGSGT